MAETKLTQH